MRIALWLLCGPSTCRSLRPRRGAPRTPAARPHRTWVDNVVVDDAEETVEPKGLRAGRTQRIKGSAGAGPNASALRSLERRHHLCLVLDEARRLEARRRSRADARRAPRHAAASAPRCAGEANKSGGPRGDPAALAAPLGAALHVLRPQRAQPVLLQRRHATPVDGGRRHTGARVHHLLAGLRLRLHLGTRGV